MNESVKKPNQTKKLPLAFDKKEIPNSFQQVYMWNFNHYDDYCHFAHYQKPFRIWLQKWKMYRENLENYKNNVKEKNNPQKHSG